MKYFSSYPPQSYTNPFFKLLASHLKKLDWKDATFNFKLIPLVKNRNKVEILWFHWPSYIWRSSNLAVCYLKSTKFIINVLMAKLLNYKLVWSAHNVLPHEYNSFKLEFFMRKFICKNFDLVIGHSKNTLEMLQEKKLFPKKYIVAVHGHYENEYHKSNKLITRESIGFNKEDIIILLKTGAKNFNSAKKFIDTIKNVEYKNIKLLIIGKPILDLKKTKLIEGYISSEDLSSYMNLCDFVCLPYINITTSGAFFLALTFNKPVIAKNISFFKSQTSKQTAILYENKQDLLLKLDLLDKHEFNIDESKLRLLKNKYSWSKSAPLVADVFDVL
jgi:glycosyltransferase involved in cell wall biosynthesis